MQDIVSEHEIPNPKANDKNIIKRVNQKRDELRNISDDIVLLNPELNANQILKKLLATIKVARPSEFIAAIEERFLFP
jgi:hypothetical protein